MSKNQHVDGLEHIAFAGNAVRVAFFAFQATATDGGKTPTRDGSASLVISPEAFLQTRAAFNQLFDDLLKRGVFTHKSDASTEESISVAEPEAIEANGSGAKKASKGKK